MNNNLRCPICLSLGIVRKGTITRCTSCDFSSSQVQDFEKWQQFKPENAVVSDKIVTINPNSWRAKIGLQKHQKQSFSQRALQILLEKNGRHVFRQTCRGFLGFPIPFSRWGEVFTTISHEASSNVHSPKEKLTVGAICQTPDTDAIVDLISSTSTIANQFIFVIDTENQHEAEKFKKNIETKLDLQNYEKLHITTLYRQLNNNFSAQRNLIQENAKTDWVLQLDTDETPDKAMCAGLMAAIKKAEALGYDSIGFPRKNIVDGSLTAHYPDVQFRLNRKSIRYIKPVHEAADVPWHRQGFSWLGHIEHNLPEIRLEHRSKKYEAISEGAGKPHVLALLQTPFSLTP